MIYYFKEKEFVSFGYAFDPNDSPCKLYKVSVNELNGQIIRKELFVENSNPTTTEIFCSQQGFTNEKILTTI